MANSRHNLSFAQQLFYGKATYSPYGQGDKPGLQVSMMYRWRPERGLTPGTLPASATFTAALAAGATSGTLSANWAGATGLYLITFSDTEQLTGYFVNGSTAVKFYPASAPLTGGGYGVATQGSTANSGQAALVNAVTASITVASQPPVVGVANYYSVSAAIAAAGSAVLAATQADVPRNVVGAWTTSSTVTVTGTDYYGQPQTEAQTGTAFTGKKAFATITSITSSAAVTAATFGTGNVLGLPFRTSSGDIMPAMFNDAADAGTFVPPDLTLPATSATGDVRGTYAPAGTLNGAKFLSILLKPADPSTQVGSFGVSPA